MNTVPQLETLLSCAGYEVSFWVPDGGSLSSELDIWYGSGESMPLTFGSFPAVLMCWVPVRRRQRKNTVNKATMIRARAVTPMPIPAFSAVVRLLEFVPDATEEADEVGAVVNFAVEAGDPDVDLVTEFDWEIKEIVCPVAFGRLATPARLEGHIIKPLVVPEHEHCPGIPSAVLVVAPGQPLQTTEPLASAESLHCTRPNICWFELSLCGQLGSV